ncbi:MAG TPA: isochorismate synthase, partial [Corynebacterium casei]
HKILDTLVTWGKGLEKETPASVAQTTIRTDDGDVPTPNSAQYRASVAKAVRSIENGELEKIVLARTATIKTPSAIEPCVIVKDLAKHNPNSFVYRSDISSGTLVGATPELVLRSWAGTITSFPLAGSIPVGGADELAREKLKETLLSSPKDRAEHGLVVHQVGETFKQYLDDAHIPSSPEIVETPVILHLGTRISGHLESELSSRVSTVMRLLYDLHPTPAVCGWPTSVARRKIQELEDFDRGMYSGLIGWIDAQGNGEWALALRGGVINGESATLYAGAGIVAGSDPEHEHAETAAKFQTIARVIERQRTLHL